MTRKRGEKKKKPGRKKIKPAYPNLERFKKLSRQKGRGSFFVGNLAYQYCVESDNHMHEIVREFNKLKCQLEGSRQLCLPL